MVGTGSTFLTEDRTAIERRAGFSGRRVLVILFALLPLSCLVVQCAPASPTSNAGVMADNSAAPRDSFTDRFQAVASSVHRRSAESSTGRRTTTDQTPFRVASLGPQPLRERRNGRQDLTTLVGLQSSPFPYAGKNPRTDEPFLNVSDGERRGHRGGSRTYWQDETFNDNRTLIHVPKHFDAQKPGVIVVFFHGHGATLERDVRDRQLVPQQISESGVNAVLLAPQLAVDAADSSAGKLWQPGGLRRFVAESTDHIARLTGDPRAAKAMAKMPVVIVAYSGGFVAAATSLNVGGLEGRVRGAFLLDALYADLDTFATWIADNRSAFFVSSYTPHLKRRNAELMRALKDKGIAVTEDMDQPLKPGRPVFVAAPEGVTHRDYVTHAWTEHPVKDVLVKMAGTPALARVAASVPRR
jgi:hypothetical protein